MTSTSELYRLLAHVEIIRPFPPDTTVMQRLWILDSEVAEMQKRGGFTRVNVQSWLNNRPTPDPIESQTPIDFHAACGDIDIPWAKEESRLAWEDLEKRSGPIPWTREAVESWNRGESPFLNLNLKPKP